MFINSDLYVVYDKILIENYPEERMNDKKRLCNFNMLQQCIINSHSKKRFLKRQKIAKPLSGKL